MRYVDDPRTTRVTMRIDGEAPGGRVTLRITGLVGERLVPLAFPTADAAERWFTQTFPDSDPGEVRRERDDRREVSVPYGLIGPSLALLGVRGDGSANAPVSSDRPALTPWVPASIGPGVLTDDEGQALPFERIRFAPTGTAEDWVRAGRSAELHVIGGPAWPLELVAPPRIEGSRGVGPWGTGLVLETRSGTLRCRAVEVDDHALLSRVAGGAQDRITMPPVALEEVEDLLRNAAWATTRARHESGAMDLDAYRRGLHDVEAFEVLMDEEGAEAIAMRHRIGRYPSGSTVRIASDGGWLTPDESLVRAAELAWTRDRTRTVRPWTANHFRDVAWHHRPAWFVALAAEGLQDWTSVPDEHRPAARDAAMASVRAVWDAVMAEDSDEMLREEVMEAIATAVATWRERRGKAPIGRQDLDRIVALVDPELLEDASEVTAYDEGYDDVSEYEREHEERWWAWAAEDDDAPADCPIDLDEFVDQVAAFAPVLDEDDIPI